VDFHFDSHTQANLHRGDQFTVVGYSPEERAQRMLRLLDLDARIRWIELCIGHCDADTSLSLIDQARAEFERL